MIEPHNEKSFSCVRYYTADEKLCEYHKMFVEKSRNRDKLIGQNLVKNLSSSHFLFSLIVHRIAAGDIV